MGLLESLKKTFYSTKEIDLEKLKNPSTTSTRESVEPDGIVYDPFGLYSTGRYHQSLTVNIQNFNEMIRNWRNISILPEVHSAISEIIDEAIVFEEDDMPIKIDLTTIDASAKIKKKIQESFEKIMFMLDFNKRGDELFRQWYIDGFIALESVYNNNNLQEGIVKIIKLAPFGFTKYYDPDGLASYYIHERPTYNFSMDVKDAKKVFKDEQITYITSGLYGLDKRLPLSPISLAMKAINQLYLIEDSLVIYRVTRSPEKRVFYVDTGNLPKTKAEEYIQSLIRKYRQKKVYNTEDGTVENKTRSISILEDFWFSVNTAGRGTKVETLQGQTGGFDNLNDLNYFVDKVYDALGVPKNRKQAESKLDLGNTVNVEKEEIKFFKYISKCRRRFNNMFVDLLKKDLLAKKVLSVEDWHIVQEKIKFIFCDTNPYAEVKKLQILGMRIDAANNAANLIEAGYFSKRFVRKEILRQTEKEMKDIDAEKEEEKIKDPNPSLANPAGGMPGGEPATSPEEPAQEPTNLDTPPEEEENLLKT